MSKRVEFCVAVVLLSVGACVLLAADVKRPAVPVKTRAALGSGTKGARQAQTLELFSVSPALFVENRGQWSDSTVRYVHNGQAVNVAVTDSGVVFQATRREPTQNTEPAPLVTYLEEGPPFGDSQAEEPETHMLRFSASFPGARSVRPTGQERSQTVFNYFVGDRSQWHDGVPSYRRIAYRGLYEGIDLQVWGRRTHLKYEFRVAPGTDYRQITIRYEGIEGLSVENDGSLAVSLGPDWGIMGDEAPYIYQEIGTRRVELSGRFVVLDRYTYGFEITGDINPNHTLVIDPHVAWGTCLGGVGEYQEAGSLATDGEGNLYMTGAAWSWSAGWVSGGFDTTFGADSQDAFVVKLSGNGEHLWSTYLGGNAFEGGTGIVVDADGDVFVTGDTASTGWASGGFDTVLSGDQCGFLAKLTGSGSHLWSGYIGDSAGEQTGAAAVAVDPAGGVYVTGGTSSAGWTSGGFDTTYNGGGCDGFVMKVSDDGSHVWSTYLGGDDYDGGSDVTVDPNNDVIVAGWTYSDGWVAGGFDTVLEGSQDSLAAKLTSSGEHVWSTYLGNTNFAGAAQGVATGEDGTIYLAGYYDPLVTKLTGSGNLAWHMSAGPYGFFGGAEDIVVTAAGDIYVVGWTENPYWASGGFDTVLDGQRNVFVAKVTSAGTIAWSSYIGTDYEEGSAITADGEGNLYVMGTCALSDYWANAGFDTTLLDDRGAFVAKITDQSGDTPAPVHRFWSPLHSRHFYTISEAEKDSVMATYPASVWTYETVAYYAFADSNDPNALPVHRFWSPLNSAHFYTISEDDREYVMATYPPEVWTYEGQAFYAWAEGSQPPIAKPVYRFWSSTLSGHFYTINEAEKDSMIATYPSTVWAYEGIAWYAYE